MGGEVEFLAQGLGAQVLHPFLDEDQASAAQAEALAIQVLLHAAIDGDAGLAALIAQIGAGGNLKIHFLVDKRYLRHGNDPLARKKRSVRKKLYETVGEEQ